MGVHADQAKELRPTWILVEKEILLSMGEFESLEASVMTSILIKLALLHLLDFAKTRGKLRPNLRQVLHRICLNVPSCNTSTDPNGLFCKIDTPFTNSL